MELFRILEELGRKKIWVFLALLVAIAVSIAATHRVTLSPFKVEDKSFQVGAAQMKYLVDAGRQAYGNAAYPIEPLAQRAAVFAGLMTTQPVVNRIADEAGLPQGLIAATAPIRTDDGEVGSNTDDPNARLNEISAEGAPYRLAFSNAEGLPIVSIFAQAPTPQEATRMATASATAFRDYLDAAQKTANVPRAQQVIIRPLGQANGGVIRGGGVRPAIAALAFLLTFAGLCAMIVFLSGAFRQWREERAHEDEERDGYEEPADVDPEDEAPEYDNGYPAETADRRTAEV